jgi:glucose-1-phosphate adenylyltransferase
MIGTRSDTLVMIMAGGKGARLSPLTVHRSKPGVPFGSRYRIIDFVLSNFVNSGYRRIFVLTQYMASSLIRHLNRAWSTNGMDEFIEVVPAQMRIGEHWYRGTADAVFQNMNLIRDSGSERVAVFGGDHVYQFAVDQMERAHLEKLAHVTVAAFPMPRHEAHQFGVIDVDEDGRIIGFLEKPENPPGMPGRPDLSLVSMGNYIFQTSSLENALFEEDRDPQSTRDFGRDVIPRLVRQGARAFIYDFAQNKIPGEPEGSVPYWRDVGTSESYFQANMELRSRVPALNVYNRSWRIRTARRDYPPARFVRHGPEGPPADVTDSMVCEGSIVASAVLREVLLGYDCFVHQRSVIEDSVILSGCDIGAGTRLRRVLLDKNCRIESGTTIGLEPDADRERFPFVTQSGVIVLPKGTYVPSRGPIQLAHDIADLLRRDPDTADIMRQFEGRYCDSENNRHSHMSAGPRYLRFSREPDAVA